MTVGKRAMLYLTRKKGRSILLILFTFIMSSFILIGAALLISANKEIRNIQNSLGNSFVLTEPRNYEQHLEYFAPVTSESQYEMKYIGPEVSEDMIATILDIDGVIDYLPSQYCEDWVSLSLKPGMYTNLKPVEYLSEEEVVALRHATTVVGCYSGERYKYFRTGAIEITEGRNIQGGDSKKAVISDYLAQKNNVSIGDTFELDGFAFYDYLGIPAMPCGEPISVEIVGIFHCNFEQEENSLMTPEDCYVDNFVFTDISTGKQLRTIRDAYAGLDYGTDDGIKEHTFFVDDPENIEQIMQEVRDRLDLQDIALTRDSAAYDASVKPLKQISVFAIILLAAGIVGCAVILFLILSMWIRSRKHEIGILLSIGVSKGKIVFQMVLESLAISIMGLILTFLLSGILVNGCCKAMEVITEPDTEEAMYIVVGINIGGGEQPITKNYADPVELDYNCSSKDLALLAFAVCLISSGSVLAASNQVLRMKPRELLQTM